MSVDGGGGRRRVGGGASLFHGCSHVSDAVSDDVQVWLIV